MKTFKFKWLLLSIILSIASINTSWANYAYMDLTGFTGWYDGSAWFRLNLNSTNVNVDTKTEIGSTGVWRFNIGDYTGNVTYKRMEPNSENQWNYFNGSISSSKNVARITGWDATGSMQTSFVIDYIHGTNYVYFDNSVSGFTDNIFLVIGHDYSPTGSSSTYSTVYKMDKVSGTNNLYYVSLSATWEDATYYAVIGSTSSESTINSNHSWGSTSLSSKGNKGYTAAYKTVYNMEGGSYLITTASAGNNQAMTITYKDGYSALNTTHTLNQTLSINGGSTYSSSTKALSTAVSISSKKMNNNGSTTSSSGSISSGNSSTTCDAARTATVSFSVTGKTGYTFVGWYESSTQKSTSTTWSFTDAASAKTITARFNAVQSTITLAKNDGSGTSVTQTATYGETAASRSGSMPTRSGYGFDGYWTTADNSGVKVIKEDGSWKSNISGFTDSNGKWICTSGQTLYAHWLAEGYYLVGAFTNWEATISKFSGSPLKSSVELDKSDYSSSSYITEIKVRKVVANTSSACRDVWYGYGQNSTTTTIGKGNTSTNLYSNENNVKLEVYYDGEYEFTFTDGDTKSITVAVPVIDQLQIYSSSPAGGVGIANYDWDGAPVSNIVSKTVTLSGGKTYQFKPVYDSDYYGSSSTITNANKADSLSVSTGNDNNVRITTTRDGNYTFKFNVNTHKVLVIYPTSYSITVSKGTGISAVSGSVTYAAPSTNYAISATVRDGYTWSAWNVTGSGASINSLDASSNPVTANAVVTTANGTFTATATENMTTVDLATTGSGKIQYWTGSAWADAPSSESVGVLTTCSIKAVPATGYYFSSWTRSEDPDFHLSEGYAETNTNVTLYGDGDGLTSGQTLTANFLPLEIVYFRNWDQDNNRALWSRVYVYFSTSEEGWSGSGMCAKTNSSADYKTEMTREGTSNVYWAYVPRGTTKNNDVNIAFSNTSFGTSYKFNSGEGVMRADYKSYYNTFVPQHSDTETKNGTKYYKGYWKNHNKNNGEDAGYYLKRFNGSSYEEAKGDHKFTIGDDNTIICNLRLDNTSSGYNKYMVTGAAGDVKYITSPAKDYVGPQITSSNFTDVPMQEWNAGSPYFEIIPTSEGNYVLSIDQSGDIMKLSVNYPVSVGDYRLKHSYTGKKKTNPAVDSTYYTYSDVIKSSDAASGQTISMYLSTAGTNSLVLQKCTLITAGVPQWDGGDATNLGGVLTTVGSNYGVYQFDVAVNTSTHKVSSAPTATKYTGSYYIKTDGATGGWANYKQNSMEENTLNYDTKDPGKSFNYYYCKYYSGAGSNLKCVIANDYCNALTDTLIGDAVLGLQDAKPRQTTPSAVNVRFSYNSYTNEINRSYLGSSVTSDFLRILGNTTNGQPHIYDKDETTFDDSHDDAYIKFEDKQNWRYEIDIKADVNAHAKLTATFNSQTQYFMGAEGDFSNANTEQLFGGTSGTYGLTLVYDFKTNKLIRAWKPTGDAINSDLSLNSDLILLREHQGAPTPITFGMKDASNYASLSHVKTVYGVLRFNRWKLSNRAYPTDVNTEHCKTPALIEEHHPELAVNQDNAAGKWLPQAERELYFISFPFDVKMSDIIHFGGYYNTWGIMYYDGKGRAKNGYWIDSESNWKYFTPEEFATDTLKAYEGYLIGIDLSIMAYNNTSFWTNNSSEVDIYFPSQTAVSTITQQAVNVPINQTGYLCTINRDFGGSDGDRRVKDSYWHCIGVPAYANLSHDINNGAPDTKDYEWSNKSLLYLYEWNSSTNEHTIKEASSFSFQAMYAYLVQYAGTTLSWAAAAVSPSSIAARRMKTEELRDRQFNLQLLQGDKEADHTYIRLSDDEEVTTGFEFNHDVSKMMLSGANIYTLIGNEQAAANSLPLNLEQTTIVPVGVKIATNGDYTFSISEGTQGVGVTLIDNETGSRTNLSALDYEISLEAGTYNERFMLEISPIMHTPTSVEGITGDESHVTNARKVMIDGLLYIVKDGVIYDARGAVVK